MKILGLLIHINNNLHVQFIPRVTLKYDSTFNRDGEEDK